MDRRELLETSAQEGKTYKEIGDVLGCSRERVRQLFNEFKIEKPIEKRRKLKAKRELNNFVLEPSEKEFRRVCKKKFLGKKSNAKRNGIDFTVKYEELEFPEICPILGIKLDYYNNVLSDNSPSFDRLDPDVGYTKENTIIISFRANKIKQDATPEEIRAVYVFLRNLRPFVGKFT